jgi:hypothetical protein
MSRYYSMSVSISTFQPHRIAAIRAAAQEHWEALEGDWFEHSGTLSSTGNGSLCGGDTEEAFAARLTEAIWTANQAYCEVTVDATYLEDLPYERYTFYETDYEAFRSPPSDTPPPAPGQ